MSRRRGSIKHRIRKRLQDKKRQIRLLQNYLDSFIDEFRLLIKVNKLWQLTETYLTTGSVHIKRNRDYII